VRSSGVLRAFMALTSRDLYGRGVWSQLTREVDNMKRMDHPNIVKLYEVIDTETTLYLVMEYAAGGVCHCSRVSPSHSRVGLVTRRRRIVAMPALRRSRSSEGGLLRRD
jgi:serine/threonine protein kinase